MAIALLGLDARDDAERALKAQAARLALELGGIVSLVEAESTTSIPKPMLSVVTLWPMIIFIGSARSHRQTLLPSVR